MQMFFLKISEICQTIAHNSPPLTRQQLRMLLVHRSKRKFLGRKGGKKACSVGTLYSLPSEEFFVWISSGDHMFPSAFLQLVLMHSMLIFLLTCSCGSTRATRKIKHPNRMGLACKHNEQVAHSHFFLSMGRQRSSRNMQEQSPANLLHSGQRDSNLDKQPPVERPVYCGQRVGWAFRPGSNSGENKASLFTRGFTEHDTFGRLG